MQKPDRARDRIEFVTGKTLRDVGEIERRFFQHGRDLFGQLSDGLYRGLPGFAVGLAADIVRNLRGIGIGVSDALIALFGNSL